jgi:probable F420-dependent oxidoreductase
MDIGLYIPHTGPRATPEFIRDWCQTAEQVGFGSLWGVDHVILPQEVESQYVLTRQPTAMGGDELATAMVPNFELMTTLAYAAAVTSTIKLGTAIAILTIRNALLNARQLATVDRYAGGRLLYGVGVGWLKEEADAMNMPWDKRGARAEEHIELLRAIWQAPGDTIEFHGQFWDVPPMAAEPRPAQPTIPILIGGHSETAIDRAARIGDGWIASRISADRLTELLPLVREACDRHGREFSTLPVYCRTVIGKEDTLDRVRRYQELGVHNLNVNVSSLGELKRFADEVLPHLS